MEEIKKLYPIIAIPEHIEELIKTVKKQECLPGLCDCEVIEKVLQERINNNIEEMNEAEKMKRLFR